MGLDYADILVLGWHNRKPSLKLIDKALSLKEKGLCKYLGMTGHNRKLFPELAKEGIFDVFHIRYNAAHRGAEKETFPHITGDDRPGIVSYTATRWGHLLNHKKMPPGEAAAVSTDCYRFAMSNPAVNICMCGPRNTEQMRAALPALELGPLNDEEMERMRRIGDHVHSKSKMF